MRIVLILSFALAAIGIASGSQFQELIGTVYQQEKQNDVILCLESTQNLQTFNELRKIGDEVWYKYKDTPKMDAYELGNAFKKAGWNNSVAYPKYNEEDYWAWPSGKSPQTLHTKEGVSFATWVNDTQNQTIDIVNAVWKGREGIKYYINLYEDHGTGEKRVIVKMKVVQIEWKCAMA
jgi:hypothetical protein